MKTSLISLAAFAMVLNSCSNGKNDSISFGPFGKSLEGKGPLQQKTFNGDFDEITVSQSINAEIIKSDVEKVVISAPADILKEVMVDNVGGKLNLHFQPGINISSRKVTAKIYAKDFSKIEANSSAEIKVKDKFTQEATEINASSSGSISGDLEANTMETNVSSSGSFTGKIWAVNLQASANSSGDLRISGKAKNANLQASSSGSLDGRELTAENAKIEASSSGDVSVSVSNQVEAAASSSGGITVMKKGNVNVISQKESSGGSVTVQ